MGNQKSLPGERRCCVVLGYVAIASPKKKTLTYCKVSADVHLRSSR